MHSDIRGDTARLGHVALPTLVVPTPARGDVSDVNINHALRVAVLLTKCNDGRVQSQLKNGVNVLAALTLQLLERVNVPRVQHNRLFANRVRLIPQGEPNVRVVQIVGGTNTNVIDLVATASTLFDMAIKALELSEEVGVGEVTIDHPNAVIRVEGGDEVVACVFDGLHVARRDVASGADESEIER